MSTAQRRYRVCDNVTGEAVSQWFDQDPVGLCASLNMTAYHRGMGGQYGVYDDRGERVP